jgi:ribosome recycling factor
MATAFSLNGTARVFKLSTMTQQEVLDTMEEKMMKTIEFVHNEFATIRTGKASTSLVENIQVEAYGSHMRLRELAGISTPEPRLIVVQPWDVTLVQAVEKAIQKSELGITPRLDGKIIRIPIPELDKERRHELDKVCKKMAEEGRIAIRSERRQAHDQVKKLQKDGEITEDDLEHAEKEIQNKTDEYVKEIDTVLSHKEKEILAV